MPTILGAGDASNGINLSRDTDGALTIQTGAAGAKVDTLRLTAAGVVRGLDAAWPAFRAIRSAAQTISAATWTKVQFNTEDFDTASAYDSTTNYRFTPQVAGYYQVSGVLNCSATTNVTTGLCQLWKNGAAYDLAANGVTLMGSASGGVGASCASLVYLNGTTDYIELYGYVQGSGTLSVAGAFSAHLLRAV